MRDEKTILNELETLFEKIDDLQDELVKAQAVKHQTPPVSWRTIVNQTALQGLKASWSETRPNYCSRWVRQVFMHSFPEKAVWIQSNLFGLDAIKTAKMWRDKGLAKDFNKSGPLAAGDVVFQEFGSGGYGHVGIVVLSNGKLMVAENSTRNTATDARGICTLETFGRITAVGRWAK